jgi:O-antigen ligase
MKKYQNFLLYSFMFSINFEVFSLFGSSSFSISKLLGILYFMSLLPQIKNMTRFDGIIYYLSPIFYFFILLTIVSIFNINYISSIFFDSTIFINIFLFLVLINHSRADNLALEKGLFVFSLGSLTLAILYSVGYGIEIGATGRVQIFGDNSNNIGIRMSISILILLLNIIRNRLDFGKWRFLLILCIPIMLKLLTESGSRVAFLSLAFCSILLLFFIKTKKHWHKLLIFGVGIIILISVWGVISQSEVLVSRLTESAEDKDISGRDDIWILLIPLIEENPIFGVGMSGYIYYGRNFFDESYASPHNVLIEILCLNGIVGLLLYLLFLFRILKNAIVSYQYQNLLLPILLLIPFLGLMLSGQILDSKFAWITLAYCVACGISNKSLMISRSNVKSLLS